MHHNLLRLVIRAWIGVLGPHAPVQGKGAKSERLRHPKVDPTRLVFHHAPARQVDGHTLFVTLCRVAARLLVQVYWVTGKMCDTDV